MKISVVATLYRSAPYIDEFYRRATLTARTAVGDDYEIVLVNDGSPDDSLSLAIALSEADRHVVVVDLSRNFGHHKAMMTGLAHSRGKLVFLLDSDLEEQPEWLEPFLAQLERDGGDVVYGVQQTRKGGLVERLTGSLFYKIMRATSQVDMPADMVTARLMSRRYVAALLRHKERELDIGGLWAITGFDQRPQLVHKLSASDTTYSLKRRLELFFNSITSFSEAPLSFILYSGLFILSVASMYFAYLCMNWLFVGKAISGWSFLIASVWLLGGAIISSVGVIGLYLSKMLSEVKRRPYTIVRNVYGRNRQ